MGCGIDIITHGQQINDYIDFKEGVPLTEELLLKAGFEQFEGKFVLKIIELPDISREIWYHHGDLCVLENHADDTQDCCFLWHENSRGKLSVHHLQNLYFALTGEELEISL